MSGLDDFRLKIQLNLASLKFMSSFNFMLRIVEHEKFYNPSKCEASEMVAE